MSCWSDVIGRRHMKTRVWGGWKKLSLWLPGRGYGAQTVLLGMTRCTRSLCNKCLLAVLSFYFFGKKNFASRLKEVAVGLQQHGAVGIATRRSAVKGLCSRAAHFVRAKRPRQQWLKWSEKWREVNQPDSQLSCSTDDQD